MLLGTAKNGALSIFIDTFFYTRLNPPCIDHLRFPVLAVIRSIVTCILNYCPLRRNGSINEGNIDRQRPTTITEEVWEWCLCAVRAEEKYGNGSRWEMLCWRGSAAI